MIAPDFINAPTDLWAEGYVVDYGSSFMMAVTFDDKGPVGKQILTYSQSSEHESPYFQDQTELYGQGKWIPLLFQEADITDKANLVEEKVVGNK